MVSRSVVLKSQGGEYRVLQREIRDICHASQYSPDFLAILELTLKEAFVNAITHGNRGHTDLPVIVIFEEVGDRLRVSIRDCGSGFRPEELPDPRQAHLLMRRSGRGVYIIRSNAEIADARKDTSGFTLSLLYNPF